MVDNPPHTYTHTYTHIHTPTHTYYTQTKLAENKNIPTSLDIVVQDSEITEKTDNPSDLKYMCCCSQKTAQIRGFMVMFVQNATAGRRHRPNEISHAITNGDQLMSDLTRKEHRLAKIEVNVTTDHLF